MREEGVAAALMMLPASYSEFIGAMLSREIGKRCHSWKEVAAPMTLGKNRAIKWQ
ncbi:hypothetical protein LguiA_035867 [Lonicera macranthoides]